MSERIEQALRHATDTKSVLLGHGVMNQTPGVFGRLFADRAPVIVADRTTFAVEGRFVADAIERAGLAAPQRFVYDDPELFAEHGYIEQLEGFLRERDVIPIAVGAGTINDLTKLAAHRVGRGYLCVATAASMDGYTAFGASITYKGSKQTFSCPAPRGVVADLDVICAAPPELNASGFADLLAKVPAGADWILADALGVEAIDRRAWEMVQGPLRGSLANPAGIRTGDAAAITHLMEGLLLSGFAMQAHQSSRPASGAEHQFSHLWDMEEATEASHGFKVGVATVAVARLYEALLDWPMEKLDVQAACAAWGNGAEVERLFENPEVAVKAREETLAKWVDQEQLRAQLETVKMKWPQLRQRLREQLISSAQLAKMLQAAGAPSESDQIGISRQRLRDSFLKAYYIRRRFTVLDLVVRAGLLEKLVA